VVRAIALIMAAGGAILLKALDRPARLPQSPAAGKG
jgi:hypothetical protein